MSLETLCLLCHLPLPSNPIREGENSFCCVGCRCVFQVLSASQKQDFASSPLFVEAFRAGIISNSSISQNKRDQISEDKKILYFEIDKMWCPSCAEAISLIMNRKKGIESCEVDYVTDIAKVVYYPQWISREQIFFSVESLGYHPSLLITEKKDRSLFWRLAVACFSTSNLMMFSVPLYLSFFGLTLEGYYSFLGSISFLLSIPLVTYCSFPFYHKFLINFKSRRFGMETLVTISVISSFLFSSIKFFFGSSSLYFDSMGMVITLILFGKFLEQKAKRNSKDGLYQLSRLSPHKIRKRNENGTYSFIPLKEATKGIHIALFTGEKIPMDGILIEGEGSVDESLLTGEAKWVAKRQGDKLLAGTLLKKGNLVFQTETEPNDNTFKQIINLVEKGIVTKKQITPLVESISRYFVPFVLLISFVTLFQSNDGFVRFLTVLLISCPCAIGIAGPLGESILMQKWAECGVIVRNRESLTSLSKVTAFAFDKTGTLTKGKFGVIEGLEKLSIEEREILKGLTSQSNHPISCSISESIDGKMVSLERVEEITGKGMRGVYKGENYYVGSIKLFESASNKEQDSLVSRVFFGKKQSPYTLLLTDELRDEIPQLIQDLSDFPCYLYSGDASDVVKKIALKAGISIWEGELDPFDKKERIESLKKTYTLMMIGDGINDAPAIAVADVGVAVANSSDLTHASADIVLTKDNLSILPQLIADAKRLRMITGQNLFFAFFYNSFALLLASMGLLNPLIASIAMGSSSLLVLLNSFRVVKPTLLRGALHVSHSGDFGK